jgi:hypothetical protein
MPRAASRAPRATKAVPNRLPRLLRAAVASVTAQVAEAITLGVGERYRQYRQEERRLGIPPLTYSDLRLQMLYDSPRALVARVEGTGRLPEVQVGFHVVWDREQVEQLGPVIDAGYSASAHIVQVFLNGGASANLFLQAEGSTWEREVYRILSHELTHAVDPGAQESASRKVVQPEQDREAYFRSTAERKAYAREMAERAADGILRMKARVGAKKWPGGASGFISTMITGSDAYRAVWTHLSAKEMRQVWKDVVQFLEDEYEGEESLLAMAVRKFGQ